MSKTCAFSSLSLELMEKFIRHHGKVFLNSVFGGGTYTFLLNQITDTPIILINTCNNKCFTNAILYIDGEEHNFSIHDFREFIIANNIKSLYINHLILSYDLIQVVDEVVVLVKKTAIKLHIYLHDFYSVCPTIN